VYPTLGALPISQIRRSDVNRLLDQVEDQCGAAMADGVLSLLRRIMNWHASRDDDFESPIVRGMARRTPEQRERDRMLSDEKLRAVWHAAEAFASPWGLPPHGACLRTCMEFAQMTAVVCCPRTGRACREVTCRERHWCRQLFERGLSPGRRSGCSPAVIRCCR